jgi:hypothetical protein
MCRVTIRNRRIFSTISLHSSRAGQQRTRAHNKQTKKLQIIIYLIQFIILVSFRFRYAKSPINLIIIRGRGVRARERNLYSAINQEKISSYRNKKKKITGTKLISHQRECASKSV